MFCLQPIILQEVGNDTIRSSRIMMKVDVVTRARMQGELQRICVLVNRSGRFFENAGA